MAQSYLVIVIGSNNDSIANFNQILPDASKPDEALNSLIDYLSKVVGPGVSCTVQTTTRSTDPSVTTVGTGSTQTNYSLL